MLDPEFKTKWIEALESGAYQQGHHHLYTGMSYCCLGVACKVVGAKFVRRRNDEEYAAFRGEQVISNDVILLSSFTNEIGLSDSEMTKLYHMNDGYLPSSDDLHVRQHSFTEIAAYIREKL